MADSTKIEWADATWNIINGCSVVSPGCTNCFAMRLAGTRMKNHASRKGLTNMTKAGPVWNGEVRLNKSETRKPIAWQRPRKIFVCAHGDLFHEHVPDGWIDLVFTIAALTPRHTYQILTKRPERMREYVRMVEAESEEATAARIAIAIHRGALPKPTEPISWPLPNVWLGTSVEDQQRADERIPFLLSTPAAVRFLSMEPLLGPVDLRQIYLRRDGQMPNALSQRLGDYVRPLTGNFTDSPTIGWVIAGGESGPGARPMHPDWVRSIRDQCADAGVPFLFKQWGAWFPYGGIDADGNQNSRDRGEDPQFFRWWNDGTGEGSVLIGKKQAGRFLDGIEHNGFPTLQETAA